MSEMRGGGPHPTPDLQATGPLSREAARRLLEDADDLMAQGDYRDAAVRFQRVVGFNDPVVTAAALLGLGEALYRLDDDDQAKRTWEAVLELPETPSTYVAWRNVAGARVREGDLRGAAQAYREADRRAPLEDKGEIANRLGWLAKELGDSRSSNRYFARSRGLGPAVPLTYVIVGITLATSLVAMYTPPDVIYQLLLLDKAAVAEGEYYRLWTVTLLHANFIHLGFNMFALYLSGPIIEQLYGSRLFLLFYLLFAAAGSTASFVFGGDLPAVGASGAVFGLFGMLLASTRTHHPVLDRRARALTGQIGVLIVINLIIGFTIPRIDNAAHIGGLVAGIWLGFLIVPGKVATLRSMFVRPGGTGPGGTGPGGSSPGARPAAQGMALPILGIGLLIVLITLGLILGTDARATASLIDGAMVAAAG
jgi:membrane associated rhomboid family serine protease